MGIDKARRIPKNTLRDMHQSVDQESLQILPFVTTHNPNNKNLMPYIRDGMNILQHDPSLNTIFESKRLINSKRQAKNLQRYLCHNYTTQQKGKVEKCGESRCGTCKFLKEGEFISFKNQRTAFYVKMDMGCTSRNVVYTIICGGCGEEYIGQTSTSLRTRVTIHNQQLRDRSTRQLGMTDHLECCAVQRGFDPPYRIFPFYKVVGDNRGLLESKEAFFIAKFKPKLNNIRRHANDTVMTSA